MDPVSMIKMRMTAAAMIPPIIPPLNFEDDGGAVEVVFSEVSLRGGRIGISIAGMLLVSYLDCEIAKFLRS